MNEAPLEITPQDEADDRKAAQGAELSLEALEELEELEKDQDELDSDSA